MSKILIVDPTDYRHSVQSILLAEGYKTETCTTAFDAIAKIEAEDISLIISEVDLPGDNSFEFYYYLQKNYPFLPIIMLTDRNMEDFFDKIFTEGIGNIISKPVNGEELISLAKKLMLQEDLFNLDNYIQKIKVLKKIRITASNQIIPAIRTVTDYINEWNFKISDISMLNLILNEMLINAVYHAHGLTEEKLKRLPVSLEEGKFVDVCFGHSDSKLGISITDYNGKLSKQKILESMFNVLSQRKKLDDAIEKGEDISQIITETGRGIDLVRQIASEFYFIIHKNKRTEIILLFDKNSDLNGVAKSSLKIIEKK